VQNKKERNLLWLSQKKQYAKHGKEPMDVANAKEQHMITMTDDAIRSLFGIIGVEKVPAPGKLTT